MPETTPAVSFHFDPVCPWTWNTSRWLVEVAGQRALPVTWRTFSLAIVNEGKEVPEQYRAPMAASRGALRVIEALRADGRNDDIGAFYTELGRRWHHDHEPVADETVVAALGAVGLDAYTKALDDDSWDDILRASLNEALDLAGPDIGSPVLRLDDRAMFGPIVSPPPQGEAAGALWDAVRAMIAADGVYEIKRGRSGGPVPGPRP
jgi:2-hydroxychromene-2-carboxylate isomerase